MAEKKEIQYVSDNARLRGKSGIRKTHQEFYEELNQLNMHVDPQEEYVSAYTKIRFKCKVCGYEWLTAPTNITNKRHGCPLCARKRLSQQKLKTTEDFKTTLSTINPQIEIIGEYRTRRIPWQGEAEKRRLFQPPLHDQIMSAYSHNCFLRYSTIIFHASLALAVL